MTIDAVFFKRNLREIAPFFLLSWYSKGLFTLPMTTNGPRFMYLEK